MPARSLAFAVLAGLTATACTTVPEPTCRAATAAERDIFSAFVAHDENRLAAALPADQSRLAERLRALDPALEQQVFGQVMGDRSVRSIMMRPPLCLYDARTEDGERLTYVFPQGRLEALQNIEIEGAELGRPGIDHAACRFEETANGWQLVDACLTTFAPPAPAS